MEYRMEIVSQAALTIFCSKLKEYIDISVGSLYVIDIDKPTTKKARSNNGRIVEVLGSSDNFMGDVIVRYKDTGRRGRVSPIWLIPIDKV